MQQYEPSHSDSLPVVEAKQLHKAYRRGNTSTTVLDGIDLSVGRGECVYRAGPSGSGKTTLLSILGGILTPDQGTVQILGQDMFALGTQQRAVLRRNRLGFVFQRFHLIRGLSVINNVCVPLTLRGSSRRASRRRCLELLEAVGIADLAQASPDKLSVGQCQRVALARALAGDPELILADEPTASLDAANGLEVMNLFRRLATDEGKAVVVVTHDQRIFHFADRVLWLENGRFVETGEGAPTLAETLTG
jgi:putative ABC transport system ATP-binding protein